jgi:hypothetical protein
MIQVLFINIINIRFQLVLDPGKDGPVPGILEDLAEVLMIIIQKEAPVVKPQHATLVCILTCQQTGPAGGTGWIVTECFAEQGSLPCKRLDMRCSHRMPVGIEIATCIMTMDV